MKHSDAFLVELQNIDVFVQSETREIQLRFA
jgi:hypothetical protein